MAPRFLAALLLACVRSVRQERQGHSGKLLLEEDSRHLLVGTGRSSLEALGEQGSSRAGSKLDNPAPPNGLLLGQTILEAIGSPATWSRVTEAHVPEYVSKEELEHVWRSCAGPTPKDLGDAADSSASGATFWNCQEPADGGKLPRMLVKGYVRYAEYQAFTELLGPLNKHFEEHQSTTLNRMVLGFKAFDTYWLVLEDLKAQPLMEKLGAIGIHMPTDTIQWSVFDIKPSGNNAPMRPECFQRLRVLEEGFGAVDTFENWSRVRTALLADLAVLKEHTVIDESLLVQVAGPFNIEVDSETFEKARGEFELGAIFSHSPLCAYHIDGELMAVVCVSILDYLLTYGSWEKLQNTAQWGRWTDYREKLWSLAMCIGRLLQPMCSEYQDMADVAWRDSEIKKYNNFISNRQNQEWMELMKELFRCCCYTGGGLKSAVGFTGHLKWSTRCEWQATPKKKRWLPKTTSAGYCSNDAVHWDPSQGGCARIKAPGTP